jgi:hypothetical protein
MKKMIYSGNDDTVALRLEDYVSMYQTDVDIVSRESQRDISGPRNMRHHLIAHFLPYGVTLRYTINHLHKFLPHHMITLYGRPGAVGEVEKMVLAGIAKK